MVYSYTKLRILHYISKGFKPYTIARLLERMTILLSQVVVLPNFSRCMRRHSLFRDERDLVDCPRLLPVWSRWWSSRCSLMMKQQQHSSIECWWRMESNILLRTVLRCRTMLGWTFRGSAYCQLIRDANKQKRLDWAHEYRHDDFENVLWTDECTVQLKNHRRFCCRKKGQKPKLKPKPKHPTKVHVWTGISKRGKSKICIFDGTMDRYLFKEILEKTLIPSIDHLFPEGAHACRFMQDNDPKHTSHYATQYQPHQLVEDTGQVTWPKSYWEYVA